MQPMSRHHRREFLKRAAVAGFAAATFTISGTKSSGKVLGANDTLRIAVAGINGRGQEHLHQFAGMKNVQVAYLVDPDSRLFASRSAAVEKRGGNAPTCVQDLRKALEDKNLDAVSIASPNHWHSLLAIWSCQAGKDVYVEKPCSHNIFEGRKLVEAARKYDRIVQHGTQNRSDANWAQATAAARGGKYGKLLISYGYASKPRGSIGLKESKEPPQELDFNLWLGPASEQAYNENYVHYNWHWFWEFGNGEIGNQGVHQMDIARWALPDGAAPQSVISLGGRFGYRDQGQTPNTQLTIIDFGGPKIFFEDRGLVTREKITNEFHTDQGVIKDGKSPRANRKASRSRASNPASIPAVRSGISSIASAAAIAAISTPKSSRGISPPGSATWATSPTGWVQRRHSAKNARPLATIRPPTKPSRA
jgi:predicted dehydrogenase